MSTLMWIYVVVVAIGAVAAITARRDGEPTWAIGLLVTSIVVPPVGATLSFAYLALVRRRTPSSGAS